MHEMLHILEHSLGLCGEKHPSIIYLLSEWHTFNPALNYIKRMLNEINQKDEYKEKGYDRSDTMDSSDGRYVRVTPCNGGVKGTN